MMPRRRSRSRSPDDRPSSSSSKLRRRSRSKSKSRDRRQISRSKSRSSERKYSRSSRRSRSKSPPSSRQYSSGKSKGKNLKAEIEATRQKMRESLAVASAGDSSSKPQQQAPTLSNFQSGKIPNPDEIDRIEAAGFTQQTFLSRREDKKPVQKSEDGSAGFQNFSMQKSDSSHANAIFGSASTSTSIKLEADEDGPNKKPVLLPEDEDRLGAEIFYEPAEIRWRQWAKRLNELRAQILHST